MFWGMNIYNILQFYLPTGAILISPKGPKNARGVRIVDLDGDGIQEIIAIYRWRGRAYLIILKDDNRHWTKLAEIDGGGFDVDFFKISDISGDGIPDIVIGWEIGLKDNKLDVYTFRCNEIVKLIKGEKYNKIEIENVSEGILGIVLWKNVIAEAYNISIYSWKGNDLLLDPGIYPKFFKKVVYYYEERLKELPKAAFYWYYLAEAQIRANMKEDALKSIEIGSSLGSHYPSIEDFNNLMKKIIV